VAVVALQFPKEWTGEELTPCSLYGVRVYKENSILATHVDRLPLVASAIINVDQDLDEPWYVIEYSILLLLLYAHSSPA
jgi:hypothetical protein